MHYYHQESRISPWGVTQQWVAGSTRILFVVSYVRQQESYLACVLKHGLKAIAVLSILCTHKIELKSRTEVNLYSILAETENEIFFVAVFGWKPPDRYSHRKKSTQ